MPSFLVYRPTDTDRARVLGVDAVMLSADSEANALARVESYVRECRGPSEAVYVRSWISRRISDADLPVELDGTIFNGQVILPGASGLNRRN